MDLYILGVWHRWDHDPYGFVVKDHVSSQRVWNIFSTCGRAPPATHHSHTWGWNGNLFYSFSVWCEDTVTSQQTSSRSHTSPSPRPFSIAFPARVRMVRGQEAGNVCTLGCTPASCQTLKQAHKLVGFRGDPVSMPVVASSQRCELDKADDSRWKRSCLLWRDKVRAE
jgi:hypothetical protein